MPEQIRCPRCRRLVAWHGNAYRPFCSERCRLVDLGNWAAERYRIEGDDVEPDETDGGDPESNDRGS